MGESVIEVSQPLSKFNILHQRSLSYLSSVESYSKSSCVSPVFTVADQKMQDATVFEKSTQKQLAPGQGFPIQTTTSSKSCEQTSDHIENKPLNGNDRNEEGKGLTNVHMVASEAASVNTGGANAPLHSSQMLWSVPAVSDCSNDDSYIQGMASLNNGAVTFQQFSPALSTVNSAVYSSNLGFPSSQAATTILSQQGRRAITGPNSVMNFPRQQPNMMVNSCSNPKVMPNWSNSHQSSWAAQQPQASLYPPWNVQQRRSVPNMNVLAPVAAKKQAIQQQLQQSSYMTPSKFRRSTSFPGQMQQVGAGLKNPYDFSTFDEMTFQTSTGQYDAMKLPSLETQLLDMMKNTSLEGVQMHGDNLKVAGKMPFVIEDPILDDGALDQTVPNLAGTPRSSPSSQGIDRIERFSRKVFVGGLPPDIDEEEITTAFRRFGALVVDWPHKAESKSYFPPKGYCFLIFQDELSVQSLIEACLMDDDKLYWCVSSPTMKDKPVQIRPWSLSDSDFVMDGSQTLDPRKTIFVGGVPRPLRAVELAMIMDRLYGGVCYAGIDTDPELKYPKGAGRVAFSNQQSYIAAISARFVQLQHGDIDKRVEVKPYVLDDQMCDECHGARCAGKFAPFFCANVTCLQYYCEYCWAQIHSRPGREYHKPLVKEGADRPRAVPFRWC
ncbi:cytoplasmic polyadenylation element-binding protein 2 [Aplysia californica]|uniref:Cytoplasmic polyadenylation element-binding protein 2 n=1 Tax=Aplysia californica TaxID=6500 RepID=A0ABM0JBF9_APLCA|nr:cytoplasmic polyadenylation element-binding protein 2 [Aplysia californica]